MPTRLSVNVNKVATLRNTRDLDYPSVVRAAEVAIQAGAQGITVHPRPDERHIRAQDVRDLRAVTRGVTELNIEGNPFENLVALARETRPEQVTLVPDAPGQRTSDHGFDLTVAATVAKLKPVIAELKGFGCRVSIFMDADVRQIELAKGTGTDRIELYTEPYARAYGTPREQEALAQYRAAALAAAGARLGVNAGHDLNLENLTKFCALPGVDEVSIGHALIGDALFLGLAEAVRQYLAAIARATALLA
jgi:pyridoxine 5-phosphate synthase